ncbi:hypothetical protein [Tardiphaga sp. 813_E8_N1_3]|uniref:hypothetical protein n=1 Tax=Tardiphaga sp. 813_E8_N1_3 TaxID=3240760 RepID=UPI003F2237FB
MNAHTRSIEFSDSEFLDPFDTIDPAITQNARGLHRVRRWVFFPYGWWEEADGSLVIFDRRSHPLCRKRLDGSIEVLPMLNFNMPLSIKFKAQHFLYSGGRDHACEDEKTQQRLLRIVQRLGIENEVSSRYEAFQVERLGRRRRFLRHYR